MGTMVHPGTIGDWMMWTVLVGGLATASWLVYAWVLGEPEHALERIDVSQDGLVPAA